jgi:serine/alanine racemase
MINNKEVERKTYTGLDLFKLIAAVLIVLLHTIENNNWYANEIKFVFTRFAVPFFFIASGFFFNKGLNNASDKKAYFFKYEKKIIILYAIWALIIYLPFEIQAYFIKYTNENYLTILLILFRRFFIVGPGPFWYLLSMILASAVLFKIGQNKNSRIIIMIILGLFLNITYNSFRDFFSSYYIFNAFFKLIDLFYSWSNNFLMTGIPFMGIGCLLSKYEHYLEKKQFLNKISVTVLLIISTFLRVLEYNIPTLCNNNCLQKYSINFAFIFQAFFFFILAKKITLKINNESPKTIRQLSAFIYFSHPLILYNIINPLLARNTNWAIYDNKYILPKLILTLTICTVIFSIIKSINNKKLNILING